MLAQTCVAVLALFSLGHTKPTAKVLQYDDVIVADSDGSIVVMKDYEYELNVARQALQRQKVDPVHVTPQGENHKSQRRCDQSIEYQVLSSVSFFYFYGSPSFMFWNAPERITSGSVAGLT
jgi:hypothetical protein